MSRPRSSKAALPYFGTKANYPHPSALSHLPVQPPDGHHLVHVSLIARHGTRNPTKPGLRRMKQLKAFLEASFDTQPAWLLDWGIVLDNYSESPGDLTRQGWQEMGDIGARFHTRYLDLLSVPDSSPLAWTSSKSRAVESSRAFLSGYGRIAHGKHMPSTHILSEAEDNVVRYTERNTQYLDYSVTHKAALYEMLTSGKSPRAVQIARRMARALDVPYMRPELVRVVAESAAFDVAHGRQSTSAFLPLLRTHDSPFLEAFDRESRAYIHNAAMFRTIAAPLIRDLVRNLTLAAKGKATTADLKFGHSQTLVPFLTLLRIEGNGLDPRAENHEPGLVGMCPFAANLTVELFKRSNVHGNGTTRDYTVRLRLQEKYVAKIPALGEHGRDGNIPLDQLLAFFQQVIDAEKKQQNSKRSKCLQNRREPAGIRKSPSLPTSLLISLPQKVQGVVTPMSVPASGIEQRVFE